MSSLLQDGFGRSIDYLRLSVTDRCDFRCVYCMAEDMTFLPRQQVLTLEELERTARIFVAQGVRKIRLTGGEPLVRPGVVGLCQRIAALPGLRELVMTTNGSQLHKLARPLAEAGVKRLNISLDSLRPERFRAITRTGELGQVLAGIEAAQAAGFANLKLNVVVMHGRNADEVTDLVDFALSRGLACDPAVLLLDELSMGLAPLVVHELYEQVAAIAATGISILVVEQFAHEVLGVADTAAIMLHGRIATIGAPSAIAAELETAYLSGAMAEPAP